LNTSDQHIIEGCKKGDRKAQNQLYQNYKSMLLGVCLRYGSNFQEAEDFLQEGFVKIYEDLYQYRPTGALGAWMRKVMVNVCLMHLKKQKQFFSTIEMDYITENHEAHDDSFESYRAEALIQMIQKLPEGYRAVFNLYVIDGYTHKEIAGILNISDVTSRSQFSRAKKMLRNMLENKLVNRDL
jgi:RNA polymerase sigma-70 factor (ECF subfamily)